MGIEHIKNQKKKESGYDTVNLRFSFPFKLLHRVFNLWPSSRSSCKKLTSGYFQL